jgi:hypothetical protein
LATYTLNYSVTTTPVQAFGFVATPAQLTIQQGQSTVVAVSTQALNGFNGIIEMFGIPQLPAGMTFAYSPTSVSAGGSTQLTLTAGQDAMPGNYLVGIGGQSGTLSAGNLLSVTVMPASSLSLGLSPSSLQLPQRQSATMTATLTSTAGTVQNPTFAVVSGLPDGLRATFSGGQIQDTGVLTLTASGSVPAGSYTLNLAATSGTETVNAPMTVAITRAPGTFSIAATAVTVKSGNSAQSTVTLSSINSYSGTIALSCAVTSSPQGAQELPSCTAGSNVTLSSDTSNVSTSVTVSTTAATTSALGRPTKPPGRSPSKDAGGGLVLAGLICILVPKSRRNFHSMVAFALLSVAMSGLFLGGCGSAGGSGSGTISTPPPASNPGTTPGTYTVTVTANGNDALKTSASATFTLTVQ